MKIFEKNYIGKGKKVENLEIVQVSICIEDAEQHIFEYEGKRYLKFEVAKLRDTDNYGRTHTAYVNALVETPKEAPGKKANGKKK